MNPEVFNGTDSIATFIKSAMAEMAETETPSVSFEMEIDGSIVDFSLNVTGISQGTF